jgi:glycosyltransferase involved in cell wall biosynthesis
MKAHIPSVSVIIPAYNAERFVLDAVHSVTAQDYPAIEVLLIDDGSRDRTVAIVEQSAPSVQVIRQPNAGAAAARNTGLRHATGEFICYLDADDGWFAGKLKAQVDYLSRHVNVGAVYVPINRASGGVGLLVQFHRLAVHSEIERAADGQQRIPQRLELESPDVSSPEETIVRINLREARVVGAALLINA